MIKVNERFTIDQDRYNWILREYGYGKHPHTKAETFGEISTTYHSSIPHICGAIIDRTSKDCESVESLIDLYNNAVDRVSNYVLDSQSL